MSFYNLRTVEYGDYIQFRIYSKPIYTDDNLNMNCKEGDYDKNSLSFEKNNPDAETDNEISEADDLVNSDRVDHCRIVSLNRTKQSIYSYALNNEWDYFVTLTFSPDKIDVFNYDLCMAKVCAWCKNQRNRKCADFKYLLVPEKHKSGAWHVHALFGNSQGLTYVDSGRVASKRGAVLRNESNKDLPTIYNIKDWKLGFSTATQVQSSVKCASYITKYITKDLEIECKGKRRFYSSNNLEKCKETTYNIPYEDIDNIISGYDVQYSKTQCIPVANQKVKYITVKVK